MDFFHPATLQGLELSFTMRIAAAAVLGMILGWERSMVGKHAGMRTYAMVSMGSALFVVLGIVASYQFSMFQSVSPLQLVSSVIVGVGFIGSGLAVLRGNQVELTTASGIWVIAGVGVACGFGFYILAVTATVLGVAIFTFFSRLERTLRARYGVEAK